MILDTDLRRLTRLKNKSWMAIEYSRNEIKMCTNELFINPSKWRFGDE